MFRLPGWPEALCCVWPPETPAWQLAELHTTAAQRQREREKKKERGQTEGEGTEEWMKKSERSMNK